MATGQMSRDVGTVLGGQEAVECGLIDAVGTLHDALSALHDLIGKNKERPPL